MRSCHYLKLTKISGSLKDQESRPILSHFISQVQFVSESPTFPSHFPQLQSGSKEGSIINPLMPGGNKKVTHTETNLQLKAAGLSMWTFLLPPGIIRLRVFKHSYDQIIRIVIDTVAFLI